MQDPVLSHKMAIICMQFLLVEMLIDKPNNTFFAKQLTTNYFSSTIQDTLLPTATVSYQLIVSSY